MSTLGQTTIVVPFVPLVPTNPSWTKLAHDFGSNAFGYGKTGSIAFGFTNPGPADAVGCSAPTLAGTNAADFEISIDGCGTADLAVGDTCYVYVRTVLAGTGVKTATLSRNCANGGTVTTTADGIQATGIAAAPILHAVDTTNGDLGKVGVGFYTSDHPVRFTNYGTADATGCSSPTLSSTDFDLVSTDCGVSVPVNGYCTAVVRGHPIATGVRPGTTLGFSCAVGGSIGLLLSLEGTNPSPLAGVALTHNGMAVRYADGRAAVSGMWGGTGTPYPLTNVSLASQISGSENFFCMRNSDGTVQCSGAGANGQLGDGNCADSIPNAVTVSGISTAVDIAAATMGNSACAVLADGTVQCWGSNGNHQLGDGTTTDRCAPVAVSGVTSAVRVAMGAFGACALIADGRVKCWGGGYVGNGSFSGSIVPAYVKIDGATDLTGVAQIAMGYNTSCAVLTDGSMRCWGDNSFGQFGNGSTLSDDYATGIPTGITAAAFANPGFLSTCALLQNGSVKCWGDNGIGELGTGNLSSSLTPVAVGGITSAISLTGYADRCVIENDRTKCWGPAGGHHGDFGTEDVVPAQAYPGVANAVQVETTESGECARLANGAVQCFGWTGNQGELGPVNQPGYATTPETIAGITTAIQIATAEHTACALLANGTIKCWGAGDVGQRGDNDISMNFNVTTVSGIANATQITGGRAYFCARLADATAKCWGKNDVGQLGTGDTVDQLVPFTVPLSDIASIYASHRGGQHTCAVLTDGTARCWGKNTNGKLGDGTQTDRPAPALVVGLRNVVGMALGLNHTCALISDGTLSCWGANGRGQLGDGTTTGHDLPANVNWFSDVASVSAGEDTTCATFSNGLIRCWGDGGHGILGLEGYQNPSDPIDNVVSGVTNALQTSLSDYHVCAALTSGAVKCWGWVSGNGWIDPIKFLASGSDPVAAPPIRVVQTSTYANGGFGSSVNPRFSFDATAGNTIVVSVWTWAGNATTVTDSAGNTYVPAAADANSIGQGASIFYAKNIVASGPLTLTVTTSGYPQTVAQEISGLDTVNPLDRTICNHDDTSVGIVSTGTTAATTASDEFLVATAAGGGNPTATWTYDNLNWNLAASERDNSSREAGQSLFRIVNATGTFSHSWTVSPNGADAACLATFK
ncbi:MAG: hypothetical protein JST04_15690 [Bdellovibrionales bacterium]|nr:hypothetical protein [Bdellovibrionales bacterium]